jgi:2-polyprenyl-6-methoxyphenol hydroxylase-like FAD-dependent oxidoreductase
MALDVVIAGGGPNGLMLACELCLAGVHPVVLERLPEPSQVPKANGLVGQIVPMLDYRGLLERFSAAAPFAGPVPRYQFGGLPLELHRLGTSPLHILAIPQRRLEQLLGERLQELGAEVRRGHEVMALSQDGGAVTLDVRGPEGEYRVRSRYLVGCDGAQSLVRKQAGIDFPGTTSQEVSRIGRITLPAVTIVAATGELEVPGVGRVQPLRLVRTARGAFSVGPLAMLDAAAGPGVYVISTHEEDASADLGAPMTLEELRDSVRRVLGADLAMGEPQWLSRTVGNSRQADRYRAGRVLLAGDAAHLFSAGGSALNAGLLDAVNLGWKLAAEVRGWAPPGLLDTYHTERHAVGERVLMHARAQAALSASGEDVRALCELFGELLQYDGPLRHIAETLQGSDVRYEVAADGVEPHPLLGRWAPDLPLETCDGRTRVAELMRAARPVLLDLTGGPTLPDAAAGWKDRVDVVAARCALQPIPADALLIRPDGYVAWVGAPGDPDQPPGRGLQEALSRWFGAACMT